MKKNMSTIGFIALFVVGLSIMLYPSFSNFYNSIYSSKIISNYQNAVEFSIENKDEILQEARDYNDTLGELDFVSGAPKSQDYVNALNVIDDMMGYLQIDKIGVSLPIYHGTDHDVLSVALGHLEGSSLPTGDIGTHTVISGHTGLPSAQLLTGLDELVEGDTFTLTILGEVLTYQVVNIYVVLPDDVSNLAIQSDKALCTLITCTPYGVNSHRLLLQAERIETLEDNIVENTKTLAYAKYIPSIILILIIILLLLFVRVRKKRKKKNNSKEIKTGLEQGGIVDEKISS